MLLTWMLVEKVLLLNRRPKPRKDSCICLVACESRWCSKVDSVYIQLLEISYNYLQSYRLDR